MNWFVYVCLITIVTSSALRVLPINDGWAMNIISGPSESDSLKNKIYQTSVPTTVHLDLLTAGDIPDPFIKDNYPKV
jgi:hypothetical protein